MWWALGGILVVAAALRWMSGRKHTPDRAEMVGRAYETLQRARPVAIASAPNGPVVIRGRVSPVGEALSAPATERPCVFYDFRIDDVMSIPRTPAISDPAPVSTAIFHRRRAQPFLVVDESGAAQVAFDDVADVSFVVEEELALRGEDLRSSRTLVDLLFQLEVPPGRIAASESAIYVGDTVTVAGVGTPEIVPSAESAGYREPPTRYVVRAGADVVLMVKREP
jgi:hypothetical protein